jgi:hypothetical protein
LRFHYRYIAVDEASAAADLLPPRSQAFAAVLCRATGWMLQTPGENARALSLYHRYLKQGPHVPWATHFGRNCPEPDFAGATALHRVKFYFHRPYNGSFHWWEIGTGVVLLAMAGAGFLIFIAARRRRNR